MKYSNICSHLLVLFIVNSVSSVQISHGRGVRISPQGFRLSVEFDAEAQASITHIRFFVNIRKPLQSLQEADFIATIGKPTNGQWIYDNVNVRVARGTIINYGIFIYRNTDPEPYRTFHWVQLHGNAVDISPPTRDTCAAICTVLTNCEKSVTTVDRLPVCKGDLIFEENFDYLDMDTWKHEVRIPIDNTDSFASFQNLPENCYVQNGQLHIIPTLLSDMPGFSEQLIQTGYLHLSDCTPIDDETRECRRQARGTNILPPVISAKIFSESFNFRYGKVVIRAKMPKGDWVFPLIMLDPIESDYGCRDYASGQMRIAHMLGNEFLRTNETLDISNKLISGGLVMASENPLDDVKLRSYYVGKPLSDDFHNYSLTWTEDVLTFAIDDIDYGEVYNMKHAKRWNDKMGPFDREFSLVLGVSVGGHKDFPNGCLNGPDLLEKPWTNRDPKAMLHFWRDRNNWKKSWKGDDPGLHIDFIRVYAL